MSTANIGTAGGKGGLTTSKYTITNTTIVLRTPAPFGVGDNQEMQEAADFASKTAPSTINS